MPTAGDIRKILGDANDEQEVRFEVTGLNLAVQPPVDAIKDAEIVGEVKDGEVAAEEVSVDPGASSDATEAIEGEVVG